LLPIEGVDLMLITEEGDDEDNVTNNSKHSNDKEHPQSKTQSHLPESSTPH
jgi:hypothetical protein